MPYFTWRGITLLGSIKKGRSFARTEDELSAILLMRDIALLRSKQTKSLFSFLPVSRALKIQFFNQLGRLLASGILLPQALRLIAFQIDHIRFQEILHAIADAVHAGTSFAQVLAQYPDIFTPLMIQIMYIGQESGTLAAACRIICAHLHMIQQFQQSLRKALLMPIITAITFVIIALIIIVWIVPHFAALFVSLHAELPPITRFLLTLGTLIQGWFLIVIGILIIGIGMLVRAFFKSFYGRELRDRIIIQIPGITTFVSNSARMHLTRSLAALVQAGFSVTPALPIAARSIGNTVLYHYALYLDQAVRNGDSLSQAMLQHPEQWFEQHVIAMIAVGEESGELGHALATVADYYQQQVEEQLHWYTTLIQPLLVIVLGIVIAFFVCAIYMPLFNIAHVL